MRAPVAYVNTEVTTSGATTRSLHTEFCTNHRRSEQLLDATGADA